MWWFIKLGYNIYLIIFTFIQLRLGRRKKLGKDIEAIIFSLQVHFNSSFSFISFWHWTILERSYCTRKPNYLLYHETYLVFAVRKRRVRALGISFQGHEPQNKNIIDGTIQVHSFLLSQAFFFKSEITGHAWESTCSKLWSKRGLLCFYKFEAAIYESFHETAIVKPFTNNRHIKK